MKATDLMIGDWVMLNPSLKEYYPFAGKPCMVIGLRDDDGAIKIDYDDGKYFWTDEEDDVIPIPLTPEILEKNGFEIDGMPENMIPVDERDWSDDTYVWSQQETPEEEKQVSVYMDDPYNFFVEIICKYCHADGIHVKYVHELQHALRLCKIEKEIEL